jgi:dipeptide/tripeptide permease
MRRINAVHARQEQKLQAISALMIMVMVPLLIQLWLLTLAQQEYLAEKSRLAIPSFIASMGCFAINLWILHYVNNLDRGDNEK